MEAWLALLLLSLSVESFIALTIQLWIAAEDPGLLERYAPFARQIDLQARSFRHGLVQGHQMRQLRQLSLARERKREMQSLDQLEQGQIGIGDGAANQMIRVGGIRLYKSAGTAKTLWHPVLTKDRGARDRLILLFTEPLILIDRMVRLYTSMTMSVIVCWI